MQLHISNLLIPNAYLIIHQQTFPICCILNNPPKAKVTLVMTFHKRSVIFTYNCTSIIIIFDVTCPALKLQAVFLISWRFANCTLRWKIFTKVMNFYFVPLEAIQSLIYIQSMTVLTPFPKNGRDGCIMSMSVEIYTDFDRDG